METENQNTQHPIVLELLKRSEVKKQVSTNTQKIFQQLKDILKNAQRDIAAEVNKTNPAVPISYIDKSFFEAEITVDDDILFFIMHSNIFIFDREHKVSKTAYVQEDPMRGYCGIIQVFNFLHDSFKYNRQQDMGYLIARIFINKDNHFFIEGKDRIAFLHNDFENEILTPEKLKEIVESIIYYCITFDILVPPYSMVSELTLEQKQEYSVAVGMQTGKRLGFRFSNDKDQT